MRLQAIRARQAAIRSRLAEIEALPEPEGTDEVRSAEVTSRGVEVDGLLDEFDALETEAAPMQERADRAARAMASAPAADTSRGGSMERPFQGAPEVKRTVTPFDVLEDRSLRGDQLERALVDSNLKAMEGRDIGGADRERHFEQVVRRHAEDTRWAEGILARQRPEYASGFAKMITGREATLSELERAAMTVGTNTAGGYLVPTHLDPTILLTNAGSSNIMRQYAKVVTLVEGNVWHGVTSAGATASWDAEVAEVSDDTPAVATASVTISKPQAYIEASIEAFQDIMGLTTDILEIFADAKDRLEGAGHMTGLGSSNEPTGLFTAINASASLQVTSTTAAVIGEVDVHALFRALPIRFRKRGSFVMNPLYSLAIKRLGTAVSSSFSGDLTVPVSDRILGRPQVESDDAPTTQTTTALDLEVVFADLAQYVIVDKPGSASIEFIPIVLGSNRRPNGTRAWYMHWRTGGNMPLLNAGRILVDKTSA